MTSSKGLALLARYFPELTPVQVEKFTVLNELYQDWNKKINVVSRKDVELLYERHVLHSLAIAKFITFESGSHIMDVGTGGGFPGIPLAILFPEVSFFLVDSIAKKIKVVQEVVQGLDLENVKAEQIRMEEVPSKFDFVLNRAVAPLKTLLHWTSGKYKTSSAHSLPNGLISLKGGDLQEEINEAQREGVQEISISEYFEEDYFETKKIVYVPVFGKGGG